MANRPSYISRPTMPSHVQLRMVSCRATATMFMDPPQWERTKKHAMGEHHPRAFSKVEGGPEKQKQRYPGTVGAKNTWDVAGIPFGNLPRAAYHMPGSRGVVHDQIDWPNKDVSGTDIALLTKGGEETTTLNKTPGACSSVGGQVSCEKQHNLLPCRRPKRNCGESAVFLCLVVAALWTGRMLKEW